MPIPDLNTYQDTEVLTPPDPDFESTSTYYDGPAGVLCPVCGEPKPVHQPGCTEAPEAEPSYRYTPDGFNDGESR